MIQFRWTMSVLKPSPPRLIKTPKSYFSNEYILYRNVEEDPDDNEALAYTPGVTSDASTPPHTHTYIQKIQFRYQMLCTPSTPNNNAPFRLDLRRSPIASNYISNSNTLTKPKCSSEDLTIFLRKTFLNKKTPLHLSLLLPTHL